MKCGATRPNGHACINPAEKGRTTCVAHDPRNWCGAPTRSGRPCQRLKSFGTDRCSKHQ